MTQEKEHDFTREDMLRLLREEDTGVLAMCLENEPYAVPVSYAFVEGEIVLHGAVSGRKLDFIRDNPRVCFCVSRNPDRVRPHRFDSECNYRYESVCCFGSAIIVQEPERRFSYLKKFKAHFDELRGIDPSKAKIPYSAGNKTGIIVIVPDEITGRKKG